jgi:hypothetical protein
MRNITMPRKAELRKLWDSSAARKGELVVRNARSGEVVSSKEATQEQLYEYLEMRTERLIEEAMRRGIDLSRTDGKRWLKRASKRAEAKEAMIKRETNPNRRSRGLIVWPSALGKEEVKNKELFVRPTFLEGRVGPAVGSREVVAEVKAKVAGV